jgi:hypothetical protein
MTLWVSQSDSISHSIPKMSVDSESTHQNTSRVMYKNILSFRTTINYIVHCFLFKVKHLSLDDC